MRLQSLEGKGPVLLIVAGLLCLLAGAAFYLGWLQLGRSSPSRPYDARPVEHLSPGFYCLDADGDARFDIVIWARSLVHVLRRDGSGLQPCKMHGPPLAIEGGGWILYVPDGELLDLQYSPEVASP